MQGLTFKAGAGGASDSLAGVVGVVLPLVLDCKWEAELEDWASPPGTTDLGSLPRQRRLTTHDVLRLFASPVQVIDGELRAYALDGELIAVFRAVDGSRWDVLSSRTDILSAIRDRFPHAAPLQDFPEGDAERVQLSEEPSPHGIAFPSLLGGGMVVAGLKALSARDAPLGVVLIALPLLVVLLWWRWGTRLSRVAATPTGFIVSSKRGEWFVPFAMVACTRRGYERDSRTVVVELREPVAGLRRFAFLASHSRADHPLLNRLGRWPEGAPAPLHCDECGSPLIPWASSPAKLCAECAHLLCGFPACPHEFGPRGSCILCGWDRSRSEHTRKLARDGEGST